jgi:hypothetical protein
LSPISARPTTIVETRKASMERAMGGRAEDKLWHSPSGRPRVQEPMPKVSPSLVARPRHGRSQVC